MTHFEPEAAPSTGGRCPLHGASRAERDSSSPPPEGAPLEAPYVSYSQMGALLSLQHPRTQAATEPGFIIMSQVKELIFKLLIVEFSAVAAAIREDQIDAALWTLRRAQAVQHTLISAWEFFSALSPNEFAEFRQALGSASGFQSFSYRMLEFLLGNKNPAALESHRGTPTFAEVEAQLRSPSLYDEVLALLGRRGLIEASEMPRANYAEAYVPSHKVEAAWRAVYGAGSAGRDLYLLAEALMTTSDLFARWRYVHLLVVQRMLGDKPGTGGTAGVAWLRDISEHRFFPELWTVRTEL